MPKPLVPLALLAAALGGSPAALAQASAAQAAGRTQPSPLAPSEIVAAAPKSDWSAIAASDLLVMDLAPDVKARPRRVVIQLMPAPFSQGWIGNIRKLAAAKFWDGLSVNRVQDNYVVQWGDAEAEDKAKAKPLPEGLAVVSAERYLEPITGITVGGAEGVAEQPEFYNGSGRDAYSGEVGFVGGWPMAKAGKWIKAKRNKRGKVTKPEYYAAAQYGPVHCYGMVGVGRGNAPDSGDGGELYTVIGHAPRHLDRNIALVGRVIEGIEHLSSLPRGTGGLGFYETAAERTAIQSVRIGTEVAGLPGYEYLSTESASFAKYADARANRRDAFFIRPAGGADICNIPVPVRRSTGSR